MRVRGAKKFMRLVLMGNIVGRKGWSQYVTLSKTVVNWNHLSHDKGMNNF